jgi:prepilin-type N-terminal cleavage/methylation domain-containing protein|uniref:Prepilin-type N-terminal cleavage/methylation domain-containing protein n=1 Tax=Desulfobacca acetoxidans TaxID=60893 RepID=A0A7C3SKL5_9BACT
MKVEGRPPRRSAGFTLLELVLSLFLLSLLALVSYGTLNLCLKGARHGEAATADLQQLRVARQYLERSLGSALPRLQGPGRWPYFEGEAQELRFLTPVPLQAHQLGGVYHLRVLAVPDEYGVNGLAVEEVKTLVWQEDPQRIETRLFLVRGLGSLRFTYLSGVKEFHTWHADRQNGLPDKVRISLSVRGQKPMEWLIPLRVVESQGESRGAEEAF